MRDLRTHQGAYAQLETIRETLAGLTFAGCNDSRVSQDEFVGEEDGLWQYSISFLVNAFL
jgi:hypothetical protein